MELEALQAILMDDLQEYEGMVPDGWGSHQVYRVTIDPLEEGEEGESNVKLEFIFNHTDKYPEEPPNVRVRSIFGLSKEDVQEIQDLVLEAVDENMGMAMIYTLITCAKELLRNKANVPDEVIDEAEAKKRAAEEEEARRQAQRSAGTPVTPENFAEWKAKFDNEMAENAAKLKEQSKIAEKKTGTTGKQWFLQRERVEEDDLGIDLPEEDEFEDEEEDDQLDDIDAVDYDDDDDDDGMLDEYLASKGG
ncbi:unnamed protein product [Ostreobium quekettii]|uniref:RWD domain-containing protein n=1 Tax=Ostreobium quekettii TaxID=121088 RepID=A0A8S1IXL4_9CHLO|nr:unnamed protein product [Ostreobium quekettii]